MKRTDPQNKSLHKFCELLATALNDAGYDMKATLREDIDIPWSKDSVKEFLWKPVQLAVTGKESTTELDSGEPSKVYDILMRHMGEKKGINVEWPSEESMQYEALKRLHK